MWTCRVSLERANESRDLLLGDLPVPVPVEQPERLPHLPVGAQGQLAGGHGGGLTDKKKQELAHTRASHSFPYVCVWVGVCGWR